MGWASSDSHEGELASRHLSRLSTIWAPNHQSHGLEPYRGSSSSFLVLGASPSCPSDQLRTSLFYQRVFRDPKSCSSGSLGGGPVCNWPALRAGGCRPSLKHLRTRGKYPVEVSKCGVAIRVYASRSSGRGVFRPDLLAGCLRRTGQCSRQSTPLHQPRTHAARHSDHIASPSLEYELIPACSQRVSRSWVATRVASGAGLVPGRPARSSYDEPAARLPRSNCRMRETGAH